MNDKQKLYEKNRKHSEALNFRVDKKTYLELTLIAKQKGISRSDVCRERLRGLRYEPPLFAEEDKVVLNKQLNQIGNNLNQAVKALNIIAKYFKEQSEYKKEKSISFSFGSIRYDIFKDEIANSIAKKLMISHPDDVFLESNRSSSSFLKLSEIEKIVLSIG